MQVAQLPDPRRVRKGDKLEALTHVSPLNQLVGCHATNIFRPDILHDAEGELNLRYFYFY